LKKGVLIGAIVLILAALLAMGSWAWLTDAVGPITNQLTAGTVEVEINEHGFTDFSGWDRGQTKTKKISLISRGTKASYVRVSLTPVWGHMEGDKFIAEPGLSVDNVQLNFASGYGNNWIYITPALPPAPPLPGEGWYYYKRILAAGAETELLLQSVTLSGTAGDEYKGKVLHIVVSAEAVQASHEAYKDAWGLTALPAGVEVWSP